jgi:hypothetical protein
MHVSFVTLESSFKYICNILTHSSLVVTDPEDPQFDLEKLISKWESES